jgi:hypothetical protein
MKLVVSDGTARRRKERIAYNRVAEALEREARRIRRFEEEDKPAFERWVELDLAVELEALRATERRVGELRALISDVTRYAELTEMSERRAYELLLAARQAGKEDELWEAAHGRLRDEDTEDVAEENGGDEPDDDGDSPHRRGHDWKRDEVGHGHLRGGAVTEYLKGLYRKLVRILHPDVQPDGGKATAKLWHEVQAAYEWADVQTLERLYKAVVKEPGDGEKKPEFSLDTCPIGEIIALREDMERRLAKLSREVEQLAQHPGWDFSGTRKNERRLRKLAALVAQEMKSDRVQTERVVSMLEKIVERWRRPARPHRR